MWARPPPPPPPPSHLRKHNDSHCCPSVMQESFGWRKFSVRLFYSLPLPHFLGSLASDRPKRRLRDMAIAHWSFLYYSVLTLVIPLLLSPHIGHSFITQSSHWSFLYYSLLTLVIPLLLGPHIGHSFITHSSHWSFLYYSLLTLVIPLLLSPHIGHSFITHSFLLKGEDRQCTSRVMKSINQCFLFCFLSALHIDRPDITAPVDWA